MKVNVLRYLYILFVPILFSPLTLLGQEYEVVSFENILKDLTARSGATSRIDGNGRKCAVLKVYVNDKITDAEGNVIGEIINKGMEKWIYLKRDSKDVKLLFENHYPLHINFIDYDYPMVSEQMVYVVKLREKPMETTANQPIRDIKKEMLRWIDVYKTLYENKDLNGIKNIFNDESIIVSDIISYRLGKMELSRRKMSLEEYINTLKRNMEHKEQIKIEFDVVSIDKRSDGQYLYGITLLQHWYDKKYADTGYLYLIWDFNNPDDPKIIGRSWQPADSKSDGIYTFDDIKFSDK